MGTVGLNIGGNNRLHLRTWRRIKRLVSRCEEVDNELEDDSRSSALK